MSYCLKVLYERVEVALFASPRTSLSALAQQLRVERHTIERAVAHATGKTFRELQTRLTLAKALDLLAAEPNRPIKEIAFLLGYKSAGAFSRFVKKRCGRSPQAIRTDDMRLATSADDEA